MTMLTRLPISVSNASLPVIPRNDIDYFISTETDSYDHWVFHRESASLAGRVNGRLLTAQGAAPTYGNGYVTLPTLAGNALLSPLVDQREMTMCVVYKQIANSSASVICGARGEAETPGSFVFGLSSSLYGNQGTTIFQTGPVAEVAGAWQFAAYSESALAGSTSTVLFRGGATAAKKTGGALKAASTNKVAMGNGYYTTGLNTTQNFAEFILYDRALTESEIAAVYARTKRRMAAIGIIIV